MILTSGHDVWSASAFTTIVVLLVAICTLARLSTNKTSQQFYNSIPHVGKRCELFSSARAALRSFFNTPSLVAQGYAEYSTYNLPFFISHIRKGPILIVPPASLKAVLNNPEHVVAAFHPQNDSISAKYTMRDEAIYPSNHDVDVVRKHITKRFGSVCEELAEEVEKAFEEIWDIGNDWKGVKVWPMLEEVAARAVNRVLVGMPLCKSLWGDYLL